jgi:hypothetical protein
MDGIALAESISDPFSFDANNPATLEIDNKIIT